MIDGLVAGRLMGDASRRVDKSGRTFVVARVLARNRADEECIVNVIAFDAAPCADLLALARRPNIAVKASSLPSYTNDVYPFKRIHSYIRQVYDAFGPKRMFWGTDQTRMPCTPRQALTLFTEELPWLTADDQEWIMGKAVCEWLNWRM